jgi:hypothetical protein
MLDFEPNASRFFALERRRLMHVCGYPPILSRKAEARSSILSGPIANTQKARISASAGEASGRVDNARAAAFAAAETGSPSRTQAFRPAHPGRAGDAVGELTKTETFALTAIAYLQPVTRGEISKLAGREISRDVIAALKRHGLIDGAIRAPQPGAPFAHVTTRKFLEAFGFASLRDLPDLERLKRKACCTNRRGKMSWTARSGWHEAVRAPSPVRELHCRGQGPKPAGLAEARRARSKHCERAARWSKDGRVCDEQALEGWPSGLRQRS